MDYQSYYKILVKPPLAPPEWLFGVVWPFLYLIIFVTYGIVFWKTLKGEIGWQFAIPFALNLIFNALFTYFQFGLRNNTLALVDSVLILITIIITIVLLWGNYRTLAYWQFPYLIWVSFATYLQAGITFLNK